MRKIVLTLKRWFRREILQEVPEEIAACEFACRKGRCLTGEWRSCERRLRGQTTA